MKYISFKKTANWVLDEMKENIEAYKTQAGKRISEFEKQFKMKFPADYHEFLLELETITSYLEITADDEDAEIYEYVEYIDFPQAYTFVNAKKKVKITINDLYSIHQHATLKATDFFDEAGTEQYFPIADNGSGDYVVIDIKSEKQTIYRWNHEYDHEDDLKVQFLCNSFTDFLNNLKKK